MIKWLNCLKNAFGSLKIGSEVLVFVGKDREPYDRALVCGIVYNKVGDYAKLEIMSLVKNPEKFSDFEYVIGEDSLPEWRLVYYNPCLSSQRSFDNKIFVDNLYRQKRERETYRFEPTRPQRPFFSL